MDVKDKEIEIVQLDDFVMSYVKKTQSDWLPDLKKIRLRINYENLSIKHKRTDFTSKRPESGGSPCVLFRTKFINNTSLPQDYSLKTSRITRSTCEVKMETCLRIGKEFSLKLSIPESIAEAGAGYKKEQEVRKIEGLTQQEEVTWAVDNNIKVPDKKFVVAKLRVMEHTYSSAFVLKTQLFGRIHVEILDTHDKFLKKFSFMLSDAIYPLLNEGESYCPFKMKKQGGWVSFINSGFSNFRYSIKQRVIINEGELTELKSLDVDSDSEEEEEQGADE